MFSEPVYPPYSLKRFTDTTVTTRHAALAKEIGALAADDRDGLAALVADWLQQCIELRDRDDRSSAIDAACRYLLLAQSPQAADCGAATPDPAGSGLPCDRAVEWFHFAANEFRRAQLLARAAQCYFNSAARALQLAAAASIAADVASSMDMGLRSASQARSMLQQVGNDEDANTAHALRMDLKRRAHSLNGRWLGYLSLLVWGGLTRYGTRASRWWITLTAALAAMTVAYASFTTTVSPSDSSSLYEALLLHNGLGARSWLTPAYLAVVNLFTFGSYTNLTPQNWFGEAILMVQALVSFFWITTGATFLTRR